MLLELLVSTPDTSERGTGGVCCHSTATNIHPGHPTEAKERGNRDNLTDSFIIPRGRSVNNVFVPYKSYAHIGPHVSILKGGQF